MTTVGIVLDDRKSRALDILKRKVKTNSKDREKQKAKPFIVSHNFSVLPPSYAKALYT